MGDNHFHVASCWKHYEPCGEHHRHTYRCGGGELAPQCPEYRAPPPSKDDRIAELEAELEALRTKATEDYAAQLGVWTDERSEMKQRLRRLEVVAKAVTELRGALKIHISHLPRAVRDLLAPTMHVLGRALEALEESSFDSDVPA